MDLQTLAAQLTDGALTTDPDVVAAHSKDEALFCPHDGAIALIRAKTVDDIRATVRFAHEHRIPVVPQGARSGISGGANATEGSILLSVAGLDMRGLFIGSEGTLGIVVEATLRLIPLIPDPVTAVAVLPDERSGLQAVADFMAAGGQPSLFEFLDRASISMLNDYGDFGLDAEAGSMLLVQFDQPAEAADMLASFETVAEAAGALDVAVSDDPADSAALVAARRSIQPAYEKFAHAHGGGQLLDDVCIPRAAMPEFCDRLDALRESTGLTIALVAHAGDGNTHPSVFFDAQDEQQTATAERAFEEIMQIGLDLGGTITGEHGVGYLKKCWLAQELDEGSRWAQRAVKEALDPRGILNPGKMLADI